LMISPNLHDIWAMFFLILSPYLKLVLLMLLRTFGQWLFIVGQQKIASAAQPQMFAAPRLFGQTMPIQSAGVSGSGNRIIPRWRPN
jgi:hypothetical protein